MAEHAKAQLDSNDELGWLVDLASGPHLPGVVGRRICKKAAGRAKQALFDLRAERDALRGELATAHRIIGTAIHTLGEAWLHGDVPLAEGITRKTRALESMPGAAVVTLIDAILAAHRDDIPPRIRELATAAAAEPAPPAPKGEREPVYWTHDDCAEHLSCESVDEAMDDLLAQCGVDQYDEGDTVTIYGYARMEPSWCPQMMLERALEELDEDHMDPDGKPTKPTPAMVAAAEEFARVLESEYESWACEQVTSREVNVLAWVREHAPHWLPARVAEGGAA